MEQPKRPVKRDIINRASKADNSEEVLAVVRQFPIVMRWPLIIGLVLILVGMVPWSLTSYYDSSWLGLATDWMWLWLVVLAFYWIWHWVGWYYSIFVLTTSKVMVVQQRGFFNRKVVELALNNVQNVNYHINGFQAAVFGYGDVSVQTLSGSGGLDMRVIHHPAAFQEAILTASQRYSSTAKSD